MEPIYLDEGENADWIRWLDRIKTKEELLEHLRRQGIPLEELKESAQYKGRKDSHPALRGL